MHWYRYIYMYIYIYIYVYLYICIYIYIYIYKIFWEKLELLSHQSIFRVKKMFGTPVKNTWKYVFDAPVRTVLSFGVPILLLLGKVLRLEFKLFFFWNDSTLLESLPYENKFSQIAHQKNLACWHLLLRISVL